MAQPLDTDFEAVVLSAFREVLATEGIVSDTDFFEAGGNSVRAARVVAKLRRTLDARITIRDLFRNRTPVTLAGVLRDRNAP